MTKKVVIVSYPVYHSYNYNHLYKKKVKSRIKVNIGTFRLYRCKGQAFWNFDNFRKTAFYGKCNFPLGFMQIFFAGFIYGCAGGRKCGDLAKDSKADRHL
ncbi:MAG: hypothetical protein J7L03_05435 [Caldisericaceae bacterium]|nr:hypothetical protein [Caldisericaceae bacterium]